MSYLSLIAAFHKLFRLLLLLRGVRWSEADVSVLPIGPIFKSQNVPEKWDTYAVPKRRCQTTSPRVITQKTEELGSTAKEA
jgi:hypothetical protein